MAKNVSQTRLIYILSFIVGPIFVGFAVGLFFFYKAESTKYREASNWVPTPAQIREFYSKIRDKNEIESAVFTYTHDGKKYVNHRIFLKNDSDQKSSYYSSKLEYLRNQAKKKETIQCWVNPKSPSESYIFDNTKEEPFNYIIGLILATGLLGISITGGAALTIRKNFKELRQQKKFPRKPWLWKKKWNRVIFKSVWHHKLNMLIFPALFGIPVLTTIWIDLFRGSRSIFNEYLKPFLIVSAITLVILFILSKSIYRALLWFFFRSSRLKLDSSPAKIGQEINGMISTPVPQEKLSSCNVKIECRWTHPADNNSSAIETEILWGKTHQIDIKNLINNKNKTQIPFSFFIAGHCDPSDETDLESKTNWFIVVTGQNPGLDYFSEFEIPVFK